MNQLSDEACAGVFVGFDELEQAYKVVLDGMRTPATSRSVVFDELRASERAKHIDAAQRLSHEYEVPVMQPRIIGRARS